MNEPWRIDLLGRLQAQQGEREITRFRTQKTGALLAYLAFYHGRAHPREQLVELLWPEAEIETGRNNLRLALSALRRQLESDREAAGTVLRADRATVQLNPAAVATDVAAFEMALQATTKADSPAEKTLLLAKAFDLYGGP